MAYSCGIQTRRYSGDMQWWHIDFAINSANAGIYIMHLHFAHLKFNSDTLLSVFYFTVHINFFYSRYNSVILRL